MIRTTEDHGLYAALTSSSVRSKPMKRCRSEVARGDEPVATTSSYPVQGDDEDDPAPIPSWVPESIAPERPTTYSRRERVLACVILALGVFGVLLGVLVPAARTEVLLGAILVVFGLRVLSPARP
jgi:hypothetical protein